MPRIQPVERESATEEQRAVGDLIFGSRGEEYDGPSAILLRLPDLAERFELLRDRLVRGQRLEERMVHLAALVTARYWASDYTWWKRVELARRAGIPEDAIEAVRDGLVPSLADPTMQAIHDYVSELLRARRVSDETHARVTSSLDDEQVIELVMVVGIYSTLALVSDAFQPHQPPGAERLEP
jgi:4-carboxymuconolactone decarboxylase